MYYYICESGYELPFTVTEVNEHITGIMDAAGDIMYLVTGSEKALVIDSTVGSGDVKKLVEMLTDLPYEVLLTHGHIDHIGGMYDFDEVYLPQADQGMVEAGGDVEEKMGYFFANSQYGIPIDPEEGLVSESDFTGYQTDVAVKDAENGKTFDLGDGYTVEVISVPGHTEGCSAILFTQDRILLTGDAANNYTYLFFDEGTTVETYRDSLENLNTRAGEWDELLFSHSTTELYPKTVIDDCLETCNKILDTGGKDGIPSENQFFDDVYLAEEVDWEQFKRVDGKIGNILYRQSRIYNESN